MATFNKETKVWSAPPATPLYNPDQNVGQIVLNSLNIAGDKIVHIDAATDIKLTATQIRVQTVRAAQSLIALGYKEGDVFAIAASTSPNVPAILFASLLMGAPVNTLDPGFQLADFSSMLKQTKPKLIFCESTNLDVIKQTLREIQLPAFLYTVDKMVYGEHFVEELFKDQGDDISFESPPITDPDNYIALITCSSGTTGTSKGITITHKAYIHLAGVFRKFTENEILLITGSMYWVSNCFFVLHTTLLGILRVANVEPFDAEATLRVIEKYKVKLLFLSPTRLSLMTQVPTFQQYDTSCVEFIGSYGSIFGETLKEKMLKLFPDIPIFTAYGVSEVIAGCNRACVNVSKPNAVGYLEAGCEMKIVNDNGIALDNGQQGELLIRRNVHFNGYYGDPEKTKEALDSDGWFHTGDVGYVDKDGCLYIVDRIKDIILYKNFWVVPGPLEDKIASLEGVKEVVVVGLPHDVDVEWPAAVVVRKPGSTVTAEEIKKIVAENFAETKQLIGGVYFVDSMPITASGKFKRREAKAIAMRMSKVASSA